MVVLSSGDLNGPRPEDGPAPPEVTPYVAPGRDVTSPPPHPSLGRLIDSWGFRYPGIRTVEHKYFWAVPNVTPETRQQYLEEAEDLGRQFAE